MTEEQKRQADIAFGLHSDIPWCCVRFYVDEWSPREMWRNEDDPYVSAVAASSFNYVPCPECFAKRRRVKIKMCSLECDRDHLLRDFILQEADDANRSHTDRQLNHSNKL